MQGFYAQFLRTGDLAFDVGAYHGSRTRAFRALGARVVAVEPIRESVRTLFARFHDDPLVTIIPKALGAAQGEAAILLSEPARFSSSLSPEYARAGVECGAYAPRGVTSWGNPRTVGVATLDALIATFGVPAFTKIDVEGCEDEVLRGLSHPVPALSFEFHPHFLAPALKSIELLCRLGHWRMNTVVEEEFTFQLEPWVTPREMIDRLTGYAHRTPFLYGDVYARLV